MSSGVEETLIATMLLRRKTGIVYFEYPTDQRRYPVRFIHFDTFWPVEAIDLNPLGIAASLENACRDYLENKCERVIRSGAINIDSKWERRGNFWQCTYESRAALIEGEPCFENKKYWRTMTIVK